MRQGRLAATIRSHERGNLSVPNREVEIIKDLASIDGDAEVLHFEARLSLSHSIFGGRRRIVRLGQPNASPRASDQPTLPSSEIAINFCASTANSIGSCCKTSRTKPLTIRAVASSAESPRCMQKNSWSSEIFEVVASCSNCRAGIFQFDIRHRMGAAGMADEQRIAICEISRARGLPMRRNLTAIGVLRSARRDSL